MITIRLLDNSSERYIQKSDTQCLGRRWDNIAEQIKVIKPVGEENNVCAMIVYADGNPVDRILVGNEPIDITSLISQFPSVEISFIFTNADGYVKNSEIKNYYFADARKPDDFVPMTPEQWTNIDVVMGGSFVRAKLQDSMIIFYNMANQEVGSVDLSGFGGGTGSSGGISQETDPTVPDYVKSITQEDIAEWNNKATIQYVDEQIDDVREVAEGKTKSFTVSTLNALGTLLGINTSVVSDEYTITSTTVNYKGQNIELKQGDLFLIVDTSVPDYWVSVDDMKLYKMETTKVDLIDYVKNTDYATNEKAGVVKINSAYGITEFYNGIIGISEPVATEIESKTSYKPITTRTLDKAIKVGITTNTIELTKEEKSSAQRWLGVPQFTATQLEDGSYSLTINTEV